MLPQHAGTVQRCRGKWEPRSYTTPALLGAPPRAQQQPMRMQGKEGSGQAAHTATLSQARPGQAPGEMRACPSRLFKVAPGGRVLCGEGRAPGRDRSGGPGRHLEVLPALLGAGSSPAQQLCGPTAPLAGSQPCETRRQAGAHWGHRHGLQPEVWRGPWNTPCLGKTRPAGFGASRLGACKPCRGQGHLLVGVHDLGGHGLLQEALTLRSLPLPAAQEAQHSEASSHSQVSVRGTQRRAAPGRRLCFSPRLSPIAYTVACGCSCA